MTAAAEIRPVASPRPLARFWMTFRENPGAVAGLWVVSAIVAAALLADAIAPHPPHEQYRDAFLTPPAFAPGGTWRYPLGTDDIGRDVLSRIVHGARLVDRC